MIGSLSPRILIPPTRYGLLNMGTPRSTVEFVDSGKLPWKIAKFDRIECFLLKNSAPTLTLNSTIFALSRLNLTILDLSH